MQTHLVLLILFNIVIIYVVNYLFDPYLSVIILYIFCIIIYIRNKKYHIILNILTFIIKFIEIIELFKKYLILSINISLSIIIFNIYLYFFKIQSLISFLHILFHNIKSNRIKSSSISAIKSNKMFLHILNT